MALLKGSEVWREFSLTGNGETNSDRAHFKNCIQAACVHD